MYLEVRNRYLSRFIRRMLGINTIILKVSSVPTVGTELFVMIISSVNHDMPSKVATTR